MKSIAFYKEALMRLRVWCIGVMALISGSAEWTERALAASDEVTLTIKDHRFEPAELTIPAHKKIKILVLNQDPTPEEFESYELNREKMIGANSKANIFLGPLKPGKYKYFGEFHQQTAQGVIVAE
jgi:plastocyanin